MAAQDRRASPFVRRRHLDPAESVIFPKDLIFPVLFWNRLRFPYPLIIRARKALLESLGYLICQT